MYFSTGNIYCINNIEVKRGMLFTIEKKLSAHRLTNEQPNYFNHCLSC